jgi:hypothetical protein
MRPLSRNHPCPCGSGKRFKHCCGRETRTCTHAIEIESSILKAIHPVENTGEPVLSILLPYFRKLQEFKRVLTLNHQYFARAGIELVLLLDENSEEADLLDLLRGYPTIRWKVIVNDVPHPWRPPCKAINVGLRHASGRYVLVVSPESAFVGDVPAYALQVMNEHPNGIAIGRVGFARFDDLQSGLGLKRQFSASVPSEPYLHTFYGSICGPRSAFESVGGYDETFINGGGDDDNIRVRLEMAGYTLLACKDMRLLHLSFEPRDGGEHYDPDDDLRKCTPLSSRANSGMDWGRDFARIAYAADVAIPAGGEVLAREAPATYAQLPAGSVVPTGSRRRCEICGRLLHYEQPVMTCVGCGAVVTTRGKQASTRRRPRIGCVMQVRDEARYLKGCLDHVRDYVDGIIALDDGSTDATAQILGSEQKLLDLLVNPASDAHVWRERDNKTRLLRRARELGMDWVICCDADERYETLFLKSLRSIADSFPADELTCLAVTCRELWGDPRQYRVDGIWGRKTRARFFRLPEKIGFDNCQDLHGEWYPDQIRMQGRMLRIHHAFYHLKTIHRHDRIKRRDFYKQLDPEKRFQTMGYDYLTEEGIDMKLETIRPGREYDFDTLPIDLRCEMTSPIPYASDSSLDN